jgi:hypothetical protein
LKNLSESTKISIIGGTFTLACCAISVSVAIATSDARTETQLLNQEKRLDYRRDDADKMKEQISNIDRRTARIEGILEQLVNRK